MNTFVHIVLIGLVFVGLVVYLVRCDRARQRALKENAKQLLEWNNGICKECGTVWEYTRHSACDTRQYKCLCGKHAMYVFEKLLSEALVQLPLPDNIMLSRKLTDYAQRISMKPEQYMQWRCVLQHLHDVTVPETLVFGAKHIENAEGHASHVMCLFHSDSLTDEDRAGKFMLRPELYTHADKLHVSVFDKERLRIITKVFELSSNQIKNAVELFVTGTEETC